VVRQQGQVAVIQLRDQRLQGHTTVTGEPASPTSPATACLPILNRLDPRQILRQLRTRRPVELPRPLRLGPRLGRPIRVAQPLLQGGQLLIHLDTGKVGSHFTLLGLDKPFDKAGGGLSGLLCSTPYRLYTPKGGPAGCGDVTVLGPLDRRLFAIPHRSRPILGGRHPIPPGRVPILGRRRPIRRRCPFIAGRCRPIPRRRRPVLGRRLPVRRIQLPVDGRLLEATDLAGIGGSLPSVGRPVAALGCVISRRGLPVTHQGGLLPLVSCAPPGAGQLIMPTTGAVALGSQVITGRRVLVALVRRPVLPLSLFFPARERSVSTHRSTPHGSTRR
jgi:hypothetical protein